MRPNGSGPISRVAVAAAFLVAACNVLAPAGTKGTMPPPGANGAVDPSAVPDFVAVAGPAGIAGYVSKEAVLAPTDRSWPVYGDDLRTIVGQLVPGRGFVPAGVDPGSVPTFRVDVAPVQPGHTASQGVVHVYVRNGASVDVWIAVVTLGQVQPGGAGFPGSGYIGIACLQVPEGSQLVILDRPPGELGASARRILKIGGTSSPDDFWVDVAPNGLLQTGTGTPGWWADEPPC